MSLVQPLPEGALDIVGDVHGEYDALLALVGALGYDDQGQHPQGRTLVFVGDLCDRGPDSPNVIAWVRRLVEAGRAYMVLGNHEINLLVGDAKDGSAWYFPERAAKDAVNYAPYAECAEAEKTAMQAFLRQLPIALERADLRVVHAAWLPERIAIARTLKLGQVVEDYCALRRAAKDTLATSGLLERYRAEQRAHAAALEDETAVMQILPATRDYDFHQQQANPLKALTSGIETVAEAPFYASGRWRFTARDTWWHRYQEDTPVVIGHYWRLWGGSQARRVANGHLFADVAPNQWMGARRNVFCVDYSVGARWRDRKQGVALDDTRFKLAALRWPEQTLMFDDGVCMDTVGFKASATVA
ncbi:MAG: metallophosphoesterase [Neisseriaceae bacterium]|nr:metallophosphoesterase [Neisseriaceae bacterium]